MIVDPQRNDIDVTRVAKVDDELVDAFKRLMPQFSSSGAVPTAEMLDEVVRSPCTTVLVARDPARDHQIVGTLTLVVFRLASGGRAWIEDVVVDATSRGRGAGESLTREAMRRAAERGARTVELTSRPSREAANRLYQRLGFMKRDTNVYRFSGSGAGGRP